MSTVATNGAQRALNCHREISKPPQQKENTTESSWNATRDLPVKPKEKA